MKIENLIVYFSDVRVYNRNQKMLDKREEKEHENRLSGNLWKIGKTKWCDPSAGEGRYGTGNPPGVWKPKGWTNEMVPKTGPL